MKKVLLLTTIFIFTSAYVYAGCIETLGIGAKETAQGKAVAAQADTPFAVYYNPAGITQISSPALTAGATVYSAQAYSDNFRIKTGQDIDLNQDGTIDIPAGGTFYGGWGKDNETDNDLIINPSIGYVMPVSKKFSFGIAAYAPYGLHIEAEKNPYKNPISFYAWESYYARMAVTPTIGYKFSDKLSFGFGISLGQSESDAGKTYAVNPFQAELKKNMASPQGAAAIAQKAAAAGLQITAAQVQGLSQLITVDKTTPDGSNLNDMKLESQDSFNISWNAGVLYKPNQKLSIGLAYRGRASADFTGDVFFKGTKIGEVTMNYDHPEQVQGGIRYAFSDSFSLEFDLTFTHWTVNDRQVEKVILTNMDFMLGDADEKIADAIVSNPMIPEAQKPIIKARIEKMLTSQKKKGAFEHDRYWENTFQYQLAAEWLVNKKLALRAGVVYDPTPVPTETFDQGWPDTDRSLFNIGFGYKITDQWLIDGVFQYITSTPPRDIKGNSRELNHGYSKDFGQKDLRVYLDDNRGSLYGFGLNVTYNF